MATRTRTDGLEELQAKILASLRDLVGGEAGVDVGWLEEPVGSGDDAEVLVEVTLPDPGEDKTWDQEVTNAIRSAVRDATAEVMPWAVATTRLVSPGDDG